MQTSNDQFGRAFLTQVCCSLHINKIHHTHVKSNLWATKLPQGSVLYWKTIESLGVVIPSTNGLPVGRIFIAAGEGSFSLKITEEQPTAVKVITESLLFHSSGPCVDGRETPSDLLLSPCAREGKYYNPLRLRSR